MVYVQFYYPGFPGPQRCLLANMSRLLIYNADVVDCFGLMCLFSQQEKLLSQQTNKPIKYNQTEWSDLLSQRPVHDVFYLYHF